MKIIKTNSINSISATSANSAYPVANLLNETPKKKWKAADATVNMATISLQTSGRTGAIGIVGIQASAAEVRISDPNGIVWNNVVWNNVVWESSPDAVSVSYSWQNRGDDFATLWVDFQQFEASVEIEIDLYKSEFEPTPIAAGVLMVGQVFTFPDPKYGLSEGLHSYGIYRELSNGAFYRKERDIVRTFSGRWLMDRISEMVSFVRDIARFYGFAPMMMKLTEGPGEWIVYGRLQQMPSSTHDHLSHSGVEISIIEVI